MKEKIKEALKNYLQISAIEDINSPIMEIRLIIDMAIKKLNSTDNFTKKEKDLLDLLFKGKSLMEINKTLNISRVERVRIFNNIVNKIYRITGDF